MLPAPELLLTGPGLAQRDCRAVPEMELGDREWGTGLGQELQVL